MSLSAKRRKCQCCKRLFLPDPRTKERQRFCSLEACRRASKSSSHRRWFSKHGNGDYFRGPDEVERVRKWRRNHPGYWRQEKRSQKQAQVVENQPPEPPHSSCNVPREVPRTLQDECLTQTPAFVGLISMVTGSTLQEEIAATARQLLLRGRNILGLASSGKPLTTALPL